MSKNATVRTLRAVTVAVVLSALEFQALAQTADWRRVGNALVDKGLAGLASGPVERVWYSADGSRLYIRTFLGRTFETSDFEKWNPSTILPPPSRQDSEPGSPETGAVVRRAPSEARRAYATTGEFAYRSDDGGSHWENITAFRSNSIVGENPVDFSIHPNNPDEISVATNDGIFRSMDGGKSWSGLNQGVPGFPGSRFRGLPSGARGVRVDSMEWQPGERTAWQLVPNPQEIAERSMREVLSPQLGSQVTSVEQAGDFVYAGTTDGTVAVATGGVPGSWRRFSIPGGGPVWRIWVDAEDPRFALAMAGGQGRIVRTVNGGLFWDDLTANLQTTITSVAVDRASGTLYAGTTGGVYTTRTNLFALAPPTDWTRVAGLPEDGRVQDVQLNESGTQLWAVVLGYGVFSTLAPHRQLDPRVVSAADFAVRAAAPGSLMSISGARVNSAQAGNLNVPVLAAGDQESQIQIPFDATGNSLAISIDSAGVRRQLNPVLLRNSSPAIFVDRDGAPMLLDGETGMMLDAMHPARSRARLQILSTGLGAVSPRWPTGLAAPLENPPQVSSPVRVWLDRTPLEVTRAVLAPGYIGFYLIEVEIPAIVNFGPAELYLETAGQASNKVRVYIEP